MTDAPSLPHAECSTLEAARLLGMAVRSVQLMVDRGDLQAWKTPGGHRRILLASVQGWMEGRRGGTSTARPPARPTVANGLGVLVIQDSRHCQNLLSLLLREQFPQLSVKLADEGVSGLAMAGQLQPRVLIVDVQLPGIDGTTLVMSLRSHPQFAASRVIVVTSLDGADLAPYRMALEGVPVVHKSRLAAELPARLREALAAEGSA